MSEEAKTRLVLTYGEHGVRFAGPDLLDYAMIFDIEGGEFDGDRLRIESAFHPCCGTLGFSVSTMSVYRKWWNKLDGCEQHQRDASGDDDLKRLVWGLVEFTAQAVD